MERPSPLYSTTFRFPLPQQKGNLTSAALRHFQLGANVLISIKEQRGEQMAAANDVGIWKLSSIPLYPKLLKRSSRVDWFLCQTVESNESSATKSPSHFLLCLIWRLTFVATAVAQSHSNFPPKQNLPSLMTHRHQWLTVSNYYLNRGPSLSSLCPIKGRLAINTQTRRSLCCDLSLSVDFSNLEKPVILFFFFFFCFFNHLCENVQL